MPDAGIAADDVERIEDFESLQGMTQPEPVRAVEARSGLGVVFWVSFAWVAVMVLLAVLASVLPIKNPNFQDYTAVNIGPSVHHLLGTDELGRDLLSRIIYGSRVSFVIGFASVGLALVVGGAFGLLAGYTGGWIDSVLNAGSLVVLAFPALLAILVIEAFWKPTTLLKLTLMFAVAGAPSLFRVIRATTLSFANREFVVAARTMGATTWRILVRELLPNVVPAAVSFALIGVAVAIILEGSLAFLGLSITLPTASLGNIINEGVQNNNLSLNPFIALWPSIYIFLLLVALNLMADRLRSRFDVRAGNL
ncbi:MAG TPA: ABC transporter permease [Acidimicrobiales bacterium]|nr:ABC transporter permease [Acidimicrobiales bacterium]